MTLSLTPVALSFKLVPAFLIASLPEVAAFFAALVPDLNASFAEFTGCLTVFPTVFTPPTTFPPATVAVALTADFIPLH